MVTIQFKRLNIRATPPEYQTEGAAGMDLRACFENYISGAVEVKPGETERIPTGIAIALPPGYEAQVRPRSGLAAKHGVTVLNSPGTIDEDYRGEIQVLLLNTSKVPFVVNHGDRIAQIVVARVDRAQLHETTELPSTDRGAGGFGSTGT